MDFSTQVTLLKQFVALCKVGRRMRYFYSNPFSGEPGYASRASVGLLQGVPGEVKTVNACCLLSLLFQYGSTDSAEEQDIAGTDSVSTEGSTAKGGGENGRG